MTGQRLFISHASEDGAVVNRVVAYLEAQGVPCWISSRDIPPRAIYADAIAEGLRACSACVVMMSQAANESTAVKRELELASHYHKPFIPIRIDETEPSAGVDYYLRSTQWLDYRRDGERALDRIVANLGAGGRAGAVAPPEVQRRGVPASRLVFAAIVASGVLVAVAGGWFVSQKPASPTEVPSTELPQAIVAALTGSYRWEGVTCGAGPTVTYSGGRLVFTMTGEPTYTHAVLGLESGAASSFVVRTRVEQPPEHAGDTYALRSKPGGLEVVLGTKTDEWERCASTPSP